MTNSLQTYFWWMVQYPIWWIAPESQLFFAVRRRYMKAVTIWMFRRQPAQRLKRGSRDATSREH